MIDNSFIGIDTLSKLSNTISNLYLLLIFYFFFFTFTYKFWNVIIISENGHFEVSQFKIIKIKKKTPW